MLRLCGRRIFSVDVEDDKFFYIIACLFPDSCNSVRAALDVGDEAPLFEAAPAKGLVKLIDYLGKKNVVLAFYFADFSPV